MEIHNLIIIGSGPAGYTAAIYASRALLKPLLFEGFMAGGVPAGGQLTTTTTVYNYPGFQDGIDGAELMIRIRKQAQNQGVEILTKTIDRVDLSERPFKVFSGTEVYYSKALILATGATAMRLGIPGEEKYRQRGISACAICDGGLPLYRNKKLIVVGGGDAAMEEALYLTKFGSEVNILVRRDQLRASQAMQQQVFLNDKIKILWNSEVLEAIGDGKELQKIKAINNKTNETFEIECAGLFYAVGHKPNTEFLQGQIDTDEYGYINTIPGTKQTNIEGIFAAGDVQDKKYRQAVTAAGTGCMAALEAERYLRGGN